MSLAYATAALTLVFAAGAQAQQTSRSTTDTTPPDSAFRRAGVVLRWNVAVRELLNRELATRPPRADRPVFYSGNNNSRLYALLNGAQYDALRTIPGRAEAEIGAAAAAANVLGTIFPRDRAWISRKLAAEHDRGRAGGLPAARARAGERAGAAAARRWAARAAGELRARAWTGAVPAGPDRWRGEGGAPSLAISLGLRPWFLAARAQFRPPPPPAPGSAAFLNALAAVRTASEERTRAQTKATWAWARNAATLWSEISGGVIQRRGLSETEAARALMYLNMALSDATIACWDAKLFYWLPRPTEIDPTIDASVAVPNFPAYPSAHATLFATGAAVLGHLVPAERAALDSLAREATASRLWAGVHYPFDNEAGTRLGRQVAAAAIAVLDAEGTPKTRAVSR